MQHTIRLAQQPSHTPTMQWVRLATDPTGYGGQLDTIRLNHTAPIAITLPKTADVGVTGQPALAWITRLEVRTAADRQGLELWGLTRWLPASERELPEGDRWARVTIIDDSVDARSGQHKGPRLCAVELTEAPTMLSRAHARPNQRNQIMNNNTQTLLSHFAHYRANAPNDPVALERAALDKIEGAKNLSREQLYERHVHPALAELGRRKLTKASSAGHLRQGLPNLASFGRAMSSRPRTTQTNLPTLDVSAQTAGRNPTEKLVLHVKSTRPELSHDQAFLEAMRIKETHRVIA